MADWQNNLPSPGIREMCSWERFCTFAREPLQRKVGSDTQVSVDGVAYEVDPDLAGETVVLWFGVFDDEPEQRVGPEKVILTFFRGSRQKMLAQLRGVAGFSNAHFGLTAKSGTSMCRTSARKY